jgi:hypothetical protein
LKSNKIILAGIPVLFLLFHSCKSSEDSFISKADTIIYEFHDASVPPDDHRSYVITITPNKLNYVVDSYGDVIKKGFIDIDKKKWEQCKKAFESAGIRNVVEKENNEGCTGGTGNSIKVYQGTSTLFKGYQYRCGNLNEGDLEGDLNQFLRAIKEGLDYTFFSTN